MSKKNFYPIKYVSQRTGLTPHVIRAWENRYQAVIPRRSAKNRRLYSEADVLRLQLLKTATDAGHTISQVAQLGTSELRNLARREAFAEPRRQGLFKSLGPAAADDCLKQCLAAVLNLDSPGLEHAYDQAAIDLTRPALLKDVIVPLFREIGKLWHGGSLKIVNEHMATTVTRNFLLNLLKSTAISESAPKIVIATTAGQWHDVGALSVALAAAENGWRPIYFGPNMPAEEIASAVKHSGAKALAISITHLLNQQPLVDELRRLRRYIGDGVTFFVGGRAVVNQSRILVEINAHYLEDIEQFSDELNTMSGANVI